MPNCFLYTKKSYWYIWGLMLRLSSCFRNHLLNKCGPNGKNAAIKAINSLRIDQRADIATWIEART